MKTRGSHISPQHKATIDALQNIVLWQENHAEEDKLHFENIAQLLRSQPTRADFDLLKQDISSLASKDDVAEILGVWKNIKLGAVLISGGTSWGFKAVIALATLFGAWAIFKSGIAALILGVFNWIFPVH